MALIMTRDLPSFESVAPGSTATLSVPIGWTYHDFLITRKNLPLDQINEVRLVVDGKTRQRFVGGAARLDAINQYCGMAASEGADGVVRLMQDRYGLIGRDGRELTALGTGRSSNSDHDEPSNVTIEVDIDSAAENPQLSCKARRSSSRRIDRILELKEFRYSPAGSGESQISDLPISDGPNINKIYLFSSDINSVELQRDDRTIFLRTPEENNLVQSDGIRKPQAGLFVVDPSEDGYGADPIATAGVSDFRLTVDMAAAGTLPVVVEYMRRFRS